METRATRTQALQCLATAIISALLAMQNCPAELRKFEMTIEEVEIEVAPNFRAKVWGFNGQVPGPLIHVAEGDDLEITVHNLTSLNHTIHWHGTYQTNSWRNDGVPNITQLAIEPGESFVYKFVADKPGSLWYHCHVNVAEHLGVRGMWGPMIVDPKVPSEIEKEVTKDVIMMFSGWDSDVAMEYGKGGHPRDVPDYYSINGKSFPINQPLRVTEGDVLRIRLFSASSETAYHLHGHDVLVTHKDGLPLESPYWADVVDVPMGARVDVIARMNNPGRWINHDHIEQHTSNSGKMPGGAVMIVEYEGIENDDWYVWKDKDASYDPDFYMTETMKKPYGLYDHAGFKGQPITQESKKKKKKKKKSRKSNAGAGE